jgi:hypothetical protein
VIATATTDRAPILVVEEEEAFQMHPWGQPAEAPVRASLLIREELHRHVLSTYRPAGSTAYRRIPFRCSSRAVST